MHAVSNLYGSKGESGHWRQPHRFHSNNGSHEHTMPTTVNLDPQKCPSPPPTHPVLIHVYRNIWTPGSYISAWCWNLWTPSDNFVPPISMEEHSTTKLGWFNAQSCMTGAGQKSSPGVPFRSSRTLCRGLCLCPTTIGSQRFSPSIAVCRWLDVFFVQRYDLILNKLSHSYKCDWLIWLVALTCTPLNI